MIDLNLVSAIRDKYAGHGREALLPFLHEAQSIYGWLPPEIQELAGETLRVPLADIHGVIEFYTMFYNKPMPRRVIRICQDPACYLQGSAEILAMVEENLASAKRDRKSEFVIETVTCLGMCERAPAALNGTRSAGNLGIDDIEKFLEGEYPEPKAIVRGEPLWILKRVGKVDPGSLEDYLAHDGYRYLGAALKLEPTLLIQKVEECGLVGRGGAMFPVGRKWRLTREASGKPAEKHIVINADESEPGTFKDRCLMEEDPFAIIEAATLASYAVGAEIGWIFVRGEYARSYERLQAAIEQARKAGYLGRDIMGKPGFNFDIEIRLGAGAYICGEETALFEAIEGKRGFPRIKPPFPVTHGLFQQPTVVNNVETMAAVLVAMNLGVDQWLAKGTKQSPGTKLFCLSGHVVDPGVYEVPFGLTIRELIEMAGGVRYGGSIKAVLLGGAAGVLLGPERLDMPLTYEDSRANGVPLGSGVIMVFDHEASIPKALFQISHFFAHESCGKCFPCQLGTQRQMEILERLAHDGTAKPDDKKALLDIGLMMTETSLCGLGQTAASAVLSAVGNWPEMFE